MFCENKLIWGLVLLGALALAWGRALSVEEEQKVVCSDQGYDYEDALAKAILFFEGQRSGKLPQGQRVKWREDSALSDGQHDHVNLTGGYYDAGDNVKFGWPMAFSISLLSWTAVEYETEISLANQLGHIQQAIRWGANFILRSHTSATVLYTQVGDGNRDHECWERPEDMDTPRTLYKITASSPGSEAAGEAAAALASASLVFRKVDSKYSRKLLKHAKSLFEFADKYRGSYQVSCPFYCSYSGYKDELLWAAAWLHRATGSSMYIDYVLGNQEWSCKVSEFSWDNKYAGAQVLLAKEFFAGKQSLKEFKTDADSFVCALLPSSSSVQIHTTPGGLLFTRDAANLQYVSTASMLLIVYGNALYSAGVDYVQCSSSTNFSYHHIKSFAKSQVDYVLGNNPGSMSYMVGYGSKYPEQLHHRGASIPSLRVHPTKVGCDQGYSKWYSSSDHNPNVHIGAIVGGPNSDDEFTDIRSDHSHLEPATYTNAAFVGAVAGLLPQQQSCCSTSAETEDVYM